MSVVARLALSLDRAGARHLVSKVANAVYRDRNRTFSVDREGRWVNAQGGATIVSPTIHTSKLSAMRDAIVDLWAYAYTPTAGDVLVDVGAGVGEEALVFSPMVGPAGRIIAIEAHPETFRCLAGTVRRSHLSNVTPVHCAVGDGDGHGPYKKRASI